MLKRPLNPDSFNDLLSNIQKPLGIHHIRTILFSLPVNYLKDLRDFGLDKGGVDPFSPKYRLSSIICDVASFRPHLFWTYTSNLTTVVKSVLKFMIIYFNFKIINFPNMCSNIPASPAYGVYISQLIRYARESSNYSDFLKRHLHLRNRLLDQDYKKVRLIRSLKSLYSDTKILSKYIPSLQKRL